MHFTASQSTLWYKQIIQSALFQTRNIVRSNKNCWYMLNLEASAFLEKSRAHACLDVGGAGAY